MVYKKFILNALSSFFCLFSNDFVLEHLLFINPIVNSGQKTKTMKLKTLRLMILFITFALIGTIPVLAADLDNITIVDSNNDGILSHAEIKEKIPESMFYGIGRFSITIPDGVVSIGIEAFSWCTGMTSISIPNSVTSILDNALSNCTNLASINVDSTNQIYSSLSGVLFNKSKTILIQYPNAKTGMQYEIPKSVTSVADYAFKDCRGLKSIIIGDSITSIGNYAFGTCTSLNSINIPNSVTSIGDWAFAYCRSLNTITLPNSVISIGKRAFLMCEGLNSFTLPNRVTMIGFGVFDGCSGLTSLTIPNSVTSIDTVAFRNCKSLKTITIPDSVTSIRSFAFEDCSGLTSTIIGNSVTSIEDNAFRGCKNLNSIIIPKSVISIGNEAFGHCVGLTSINVDVANFNYSSTDGILLNKDKTVLIKYPSAKTDISYNIPETVDSIADLAFYYCISLVSVNIPNSVTSIGNNAFEYCYGIMSITIPSSVNLFGEDPFWACNNLDSIVMTPKTAPIITPYTFNEFMGTIYVPADGTGYTPENYWPEVKILTGSKELAIEKLKFFPCPFINKITIEGAEGCTLKITNAVGATIFASKLDSYSEIIETEGYVSGIYLFSFEKDGMVNVQKVVKK